MSAEPVALSKNILLVEDEALMLEMTAIALMEAGFQVVQARTGDEALRMLGSAPIDLVLADVRMPGSIDGLALAHRVRSDWPHLKIVLMSGYLPDMSGAAVADAFLAKPFPMSAVTDCVERVLA